MHTHTNSPIGKFVCVYIDNIREFECVYIDKNLKAFKYTVIHYIVAQLSHKI